jgi:L-ascorbate metabolism protein UlaG (beta-lactamase superfamily)
MDRKETAMTKWILLITLMLCGSIGFASATAGYEEDVFKTSKGDLKITFIGHGTLMLAWDGKVIHVDPVGQYANYDALPKADLILVTHEHGDHLDPKAISQIKKGGTEIVATKSCAGKIPEAIMMANGESKTVQGVKIDAVPAYNVVNVRFHPKGVGNGYVLTLGDTRVYIAGDTENTPEMKALKNIDIAFLPMNLPYTMTPEQVADAAKAFRPKVLYPYHYGNTDPQRLVDLLKGEEGIEVRIRNLR